MRKSLIPALASFAALALACGGGDVADPSTAPSTAAPAADGTPAAAAVSGESFGKWSSPDDDMSKALKARGWDVDFCEKYSEGDVYHSCAASKGSLWAELEVIDHESLEDAKWEAEDEETVARDGKRTLEISIYDASAAQTLGELVLPKGGKIHELSTSAAEKAVTGKGWSVVESSTSKDDGYIYGEIMAIKGSSLLFMDWELPSGAKGGRDERGTEEGVFYVSQGDESYFSVGLYDTTQAKSLLKELGG